MVQLRFNRSTAGESIRQAYIWSSPPTLAGTFQRVSIRNCLNRTESKSNGDGGNIGIQNHIVGVQKQVRHRLHTYVARENSMVCLTTGFHRTSELWSRTVGSRKNCHADNATAGRTLIQYYRWRLDILLKGRCDIRQARNLAQGSMAATDPNTNHGSIPERSDSERSLDDSLSLEMPSESDIHIQQKKSTFTL
ncbi:hypothetical protein BKA82DRAFT_2289053 [Pisolithus tinctorius]|nr:hypothetical protein BKA82DRAFT_2289053 [Pisolithus tinctorius]